MYPTIDMKATGMCIRRIMNQRNLSVKDVQKYLNLSSVQSVYHWLNGQSVPTVDNLYALSELFQLPVDALLVGNRKYQSLLFDDSFGSRIYAYYHAVKELYVRFFVSRDFRNRKDSCDDSSGFRTYSPG